MLGGGGGAFFEKVEAVEDVAEAERPSEEGAPEPEAAR